MLRIGQGWDRHPLAAGRRCVLGGVTFADAESGPIGHSDADVLVHAIIDAVLGAAGLGDIGTHFPDSDPAYEDADSCELLRRALRLVRSAGYRPLNLDATVIAEVPLIAPYRDAMVANLAANLDLPSDHVNVKATRGEGLGPEGRAECLTALAIVLLEPVG